ncbi:unnamed protein product [Prorocentrum cordatum]|uniref:Uncharacterized protein n=1 Tax=Prorocentrum cordatum TaxID=2364126 RepID=A0ABN9S104_9DINO|nr:unnamed protein product [Polarella glacialis]
MSTYEERRPGSRLLVRFAGDEWTHERILLRPVHRDRRNECRVIETVDRRWRISLMHGWPEGFACDAARFRAEVGREGLRQMVLEGRDLAREERRRRRFPPDLGAHLGEEPTTMVDWHGDECGLEAGALGAARRRLRGATLAGWRPRARGAWR